MGNFIEVDLVAVKGMSGKIDTFLGKYKKSIQQGNISISSVRSYWRGNDFLSFNLKWNDITSSSDSTSENMKKELESYKNLLGKVAKKYILAQAKAIELADELPNW